MERMHSPPTTLFERRKVLFRGPSVTLDELSPGKMVVSIDVCVGWGGGGRAGRGVRHSHVLHQRYQMCNLPICRIGPPRIRQLDELTSSPVPRVLLHNISALLSHEKENPASPLQGLS